MKNLFSLKSLILAVLAMVPFGSMWAAPRSAAQARAIAMKFMGVSSSVMAKAPVKKVAAKEHAPYYIYNVERPQGGFVVVSGDDRFSDILGYSQSGSFDEDKPMPDGLAYWLNTLQGEMEHAVANGYEGGQRRAPSTLRASVEPLITTKWGQEAPFNNDCPMSGGVRCVAGCVAIGMAQIINYWKPLPDSYDYDNMLDVYNKGAYTDAQAAAVAKLVSDCGVAVGMDYGTSASGATGQAAATVFVQKFKFNKNLHHVVRDYESYGVFRDIVLDELAAKRPIPIGGSAQDHSSGHYFVLDGYDAKQDLFHFNWGWDGYLDGYYALSALTPGSGGTGAGAGDFNYYQYIVVGLQPEAEGEPYHLFTFDDVTPNAETCNRGPGIALNITHLTNYAVNFNGEIGVAAYDADGNLVSANTTALDSSFKPGYSYPEFILYTTNFGATKFPYGEYDLYLVAKRLREDNYYRMKSLYGHPDHIHIVVSPDDNKVHFSIPEIPEVQISDNNQVPVLLGDGQNDVYVGLPAQFQITLTNKGEGEFHDEVGVVLSYGMKAVNTQYIVQTVRLAPGETQTFTVGGYIHVETTGVKYNVTPVYGQNGSYTKLSTTLSVNMKEGSDGIDRLNADDAAMQGDRAAKTPSFDLNGRPTTDLRRGIVISQGKKVLK